MLKEYRLMKIIETLKWQSSVHDFYHRRWVWNINGNHSVLWRECIESILMSHAIGSVSKWNLITHHQFERHAQAHCTHIPEQTKERKERMGALKAARIKRYDSKSVIKMMSSFRYRFNLIKILASRSVTGCAMRRWSAVGNAKWAICTYSLFASCSECILAWKRTCALHCTP